MRGVRLYYGIEGMASFSATKSQLESQTFVQGTPTVLMAGCEAGFRGRSLRSSEHLR